jgi:ornithine cyclodeaminase/alanine dehydrogenase-like protein (mu-crystallin family)
VPGRRSPDERILFDSTGVAIQDVAAAIAVRKRAMQAGEGLRIDLNAA